MINEFRHKIKQNSFISSQTAFKLAHRWQTKWSTSKRYTIIIFFVKNLMQRWHVFDEKRIDFIKIEKSRFSLSSSKNLRREEFHANDITTKRKREKRIENFEDKKSIKSKQTIYEKTKLEKKKQERKNVFYVKTNLLLIFAQSTIYFRIHSTKFTTFLIYEKWLFLMNFNKIIIKNSIWILTQSKWLTSRLTIREMKILRINQDHFSRWKKSFTILNESRRFLDV